MIACGVSALNSILFDVKVCGANLRVQAVPTWASDSEILLKPVSLVLELLYFAFVGSQTVMLVSQNVLVVFIASEASLLRQGTRLRMFLYLTLEVGQPTVTLHSAEGTIFLML